MKLSQMCRTALIATMMPILSSGLDMRGLAQANLLPLPPAIPSWGPCLCLHSSRTVGAQQKELLRIAYERGAFTLIDFQKLLDRE